MLLQVDCLQMDPYMTELFGRGNREGLLHWLRDGTLVINNVHKVCATTESEAWLRCWHCAGLWGSVCTLGLTPLSVTHSIICQGYWTQWHKLRCGPGSSLQVSFPQNSDHMPAMPP